MEVEGYVLPESLEWYLYNGAWKDQHFEGCETFVSLHIKGSVEILYGHVFPTIINNECIYVFVPCRDTWRGPILLIPGEHYIAHMKTHANQTTLSKISKLKKEIAKLEAQESHNV